MKMTPQTSIYILNDREHYAHTHMCLLFFFFFSFHFHFHFFFLHIYEHTYPEHEQMNPKDDVDNGWTPSQVLRQAKTLSNEMTFSN